MSVQEKFSEVIKARRIELNMSLEDVAKKLGVYRSTVYRWEQGKVNGIKTPHIYLLSKILYVPTEVLLGGDSELEDAEVVKARLAAIESLDKVKKKEDLELIDKYIKVFYVNK